jgi:hypothetical protein
MTPIDNNPSSCVKAQVVRDALLEIAKSATNHRVLTAASMLVAQATDAEMQRLGRLLK